MEGSGGNSTEIEARPIFAAVHSMHIFFCIIALCISSVHMHALRFHMRNIHKCTRVSLWIGVIGSLSATVAQLMYSILLLIYEGVAGRADYFMKYDLSSVESELTTAPPRQTVVAVALTEALSWLDDPHSIPCIVLMGFWAEMGQIVVLSIAAIAVERVVVLYYHPSATETSSHKAVFIGHTILFGMSFVVSICLVTVQSSEIEGGICELSLIPTTKLRLIACFMHLVVLVLEVAIIWVISRRTTEMLDGYFVNQASLNLRTRVTIERSIEISRVVKTSLCIQFTFYVITMVTFACGPILLDDQNARGFNNAMQTLGFYIPVAIFSSLHNGNCLRLAVMCMRRRSFDSDSTRCNSMCKQFQKRNSFHFGQPADAFGPNESDVRFQELQDMWNTQYQKRSSK